MSEDFYKVLGINRNATQPEIQKAYRDAARKYHPDMNPDDKTAKAKFQKVQEAYDVLNDPEKRELYDRYGSSFETMGAGGPGGGQWRSTGGGAGPGPGFEDFDFSQIFGQRYSPEGAAGFEDIFRQFGGGGGAGAAGGTRSRKRGRKAKGADVTHEITIPFRDAIVGGQASFSVHRPSGTETITAKIPAGIEDGKQIRLRGQGEQVEGGTSGDLLITIHVASHPHFTRHSNNLEVKLPVSLSEAAGGAKIDLPTPHGTLTLKIPPGTSSGKKLRLKGQGVHPKSGEPGDLFAVVEIMLPPSLSDEERAWLVQLGEKHPQNPRADLQW